MTVGRALDNVLYILDIDDIIEVIEAVDIFDIPSKGDEITIDINSIMDDEDDEIKKFIEIHGSSYIVDKLREDFCGRKNADLKKYILVFLRPKNNMNKEENL